MDLEFEVNGLNCKCSARGFDGTKYFENEGRGRFSPRELAVILDRHHTTVSVWGGRSTRGLLP